MTMTNSGSPQKEEPQTNPSGQITPQDKAVKRRIKQSKRGGKRKKVSNHKRRNHDESDDNGESLVELLSGILHLLIKLKRRLATRKKPKPQQRKRK